MYLEKFVLPINKEEKLIDTAVTCGTPFLGSQSAYTSVSAGTLFGLLSPSDSFFSSFPSLYELMPRSALDKAGVMSENGEPLDVSTAAQSKAYAYHTAVSNNLSSIWENVKHVNIVGTGSETPGESGNETGDGTVTLYSARAGGLFDGVTTEFEMSHTEIVQKNAPLKAIVNSLKAEEE